MPQVTSRCGGLDCDGSLVSNPRRGDEGHGVVWVSPFDIWRTLSHIERALVVSPLVVLGFLLLYTLGILVVITTTGYRNGLLIVPFAVLGGIWFVLFVLSLVVWAKRSVQLGRRLRIERDEARRR